MWSTPLIRPVFSFGINEEARFRAVNIQEYRPGFYEFDVLELGEQFAHIKLGVPGYHNIYNALAMCCACARWACSRRCRTRRGRVSRHRPPV